MTPEPQTPTALLTVPEAAERLRIHPDTLYKAIRRNTSPVQARRIGRRVLVPAVEVERFAEVGV